MNLNMTRKITGLRKLNLKMRWSYFLFLTVLAISCLIILNCKPGGKNSSDTNNEQNGTPVNIDPVNGALLDFMTRQLQANGVPGGAIAIVSNGTLSNASGVGVKNHSSDSRVRPDTYFINCSISIGVRGGLRASSFTPAPIISEKVKILPS